MRKIINKLARIKNGILVRFKYHLDVNKLAIKESGLTADDVPFVELVDGPVFFGFKATLLQKLFYIFFIKKSIGLKMTCTRVAFDIVLRYNEIQNREKFSDFKEGDVILEIGAFIGYYVIRAANMIKKTGHIIAIEAIEENFLLLKRNKEENKLENVSVINKASWNKTGTLSFKRQHRQRASAKDDIVIKNQEIEVLCDTVDNMLSGLGISHVDFARIQVNGAELETLKGMTQTLKSFPRLSVAGIYNKDQTFECIQLLTNLGYSIEHYKGTICASRQ